MFWAGRRPRKDMPSASPKSRPSPSPPPSAIVAALIMAIGSYAVLCVYGFATMIDDRIRGRDRWLAILKEMFLTPSVVIVIFGIVALCIGAFIGATSLQHALGIRVRGPRTAKAIAIFAMIVLFAAVLLFVSS